MTFIPFNLGQTSPVTVQIIDDLGRMLRELVAGTFPGGTYDRDNGAPGWDGKDSRGRNVPSGVYFYRVITNEYIETQNLVLVR